MPGKYTVGAQPCCLCWSLPVSAHPQWSCPPDPTWGEQNTRGSAISNCSQVAKAQWHKLMHSKLITQWTNRSRLELRNSLFIIKEYSWHLKFHHCLLHCSFNAPYTNKIFRMRRSLLPRSWYWGQWQHTANNGWGWSRGHWWCHHCPGCRGACLHSGPTAWPGRPAQK